MALTRAVARAAKLRVAGPTLAAVPASAPAVARTLLGTIAVDLASTAATRLTDGEIGLASFRRLPFGAR